VQGENSTFSNLVMASGGSAREKDAGRFGGDHWHPELGVRHCQTCSFTSLANLGPRPQDPVARYARAVTSARGETSAANHVDYQQQTNSLISCLRCGLHISDSAGAEEVDEWQTNPLTAWRSRLECRWTEIGALIALRGFSSFGVASLTLAEAGSHMFTAIQELGQVHLPYARHGAFHKRRGVSIASCNHLYRSHHKLAT